MESAVQDTVEQQVFAKAEELLRVAHEFWKLQQRLTNNGAVKWVSYTSGEIIIFTRGEYRDTLMRNIQELEGPHYFTGVAHEKPDEAV